ncbi:MAG: class I SAM-dependent methyltransferase [Candidatus Omnitrophica bacterium]|nr:class I SAM-dependent methyltransferase [Candidatus Omnitrophota bacterium]
MIKKIYYWLHRRFSKPEEKGEYSAGYWQNLVRREVLERCSGISGNILEVGCGEGLFLRQLSEKNKTAKIFGLDIWADIIIKAKNRFRENNIKGIELQQADACCLPYKNECFDAVICINVFFNLESEDKVKKSLKEINRILKKSGKIFFDIRNSLNPLLYIKYKLAGYYDETVKGLPLKTYNFNKIVLLLKENNFKFVKKTNIGFPDNWLAPIFAVEAQKI